MWFTACYITAHEQNTTLFGFENLKRKFKTCKLPKLFEIFSATSIKLFIEECLLPFLEIFLDYLIDLTVKLFRPNP
jgi:hypothetical protein